MPMVELVKRAEVVIDEVIEVMGGATVEAVLEMSAHGVVGPGQAGKGPQARGTGMAWGAERVVYLSERKLRVRKPRLRRWGEGQRG